MPTREIHLDTAAFLDTRHCKALDAVPREDARKIVEAFLSVAYDELGKAPRHLDGDDVHSIVGHLLPGHFGRRDPIAQHVPDVLRAYLEFLNESAVVSNLFEMKRALEGTLDEFAHAVETGVHAHHAPQKAQKPFVHTVDKVGRNDPCPCGSQKKFKQCCAKLGN